ncbi:MAG: DUF86 domain-containing protein [Coriobacteriia bacterium]|nr:DUF86 domain-containing protein [Coriobacteriia bacterium]
MRELDREALRERLDRVVVETDAIAARLPASATEYASQEAESLRYELEHRLFIALQAMLDAAAHVAVTQGARPIETYGDAIEALVRLGIVEEELGRALVAASGLRNALAHEYLRLDHTRVYEALRGARELRRFARRLWEWATR